MPIQTNRKTIDRSQIIRPFVKRHRNDLAEQINEYLDKQQLLPESQSAYR